MIGRQAVKFIYSAEKEVPVGRDGRLKSSGEMMLTNSRHQIMAGPTRYPPVTVDDAFLSFRNSRRDPIVGMLRSGDDEKGFRKYLDRVVPILSGLCEISKPFLRGNGCITKEDREDIARVFAYVMMPEGARHDYFAQNGVKPFKDANTYVECFNEQCPRVHSVDPEEVDDYMRVLCSPECGESETSVFDSRNQETYTVRWKYGDLVSEVLSRLPVPLGDGDILYNDRMRRAITHMDHHFNTCVAPGFTDRLTIRGVKRVRVEEPEPAPAPAPEPIVSIVTMDFLDALTDEELVPDDHFGFLSTTASPENSVDFERNTCYNIEEDKVVLNKFLVDIGCVERPARWSTFSVNAAGCETRLTAIPRRTSIFEDQRAAARDMAYIFTSFMRAWDYKPIGMSGIASEDADGFLWDMLAGVEGGDAPALVPSNYFCRFATVQEAFAETRDFFVTVAECVKGISKKQMLESGDSSGVKVKWKRQPWGKFIACLQKKTADQVQNALYKLIGELE